MCRKRDSALGSRTVSFPEGNVGFNTENVSGIGKGYKSALDTQLTFSSTKSQELVNR